MRSILVTALLITIGFIAFAQFLRRTSMFFPAPYPAGEWNAARYAVPPVDHFFTASDGVKLHAWLFPAENADAPVMIWFHGNGGNLTLRGEMAAELARRGISVFVFDYRGFGRSEGAPSEAKLFLDSIAAFEYVAKTLRPTRIALYGESLGGPYAAWVAKERPVHCVIIENSFPSLRALGNTIYRPLPLGYTAPRALRTTEWLNAAGVPVLVMHGRNDRVIPFTLGKQLYDGLRVKKEMLISENAGHSEIPFLDSTRYYEAVVRFITDSSQTPPYR
ncbi:MAG TPA: alpha/beta hydrolase [Thermoanaerobaculia bacterium]|jgi:hypothetical protein